MRAVARLLGKLALLGGERSFIRRNQALWNRPGSQILVAPERSRQDDQSKISMSAASLADIEVFLRSVCLVRSGFHFAR